MISIWSAQPGLRPVRGASIFTLLDDSSPLPLARPHQNFLNCARKPSPPLCRKKRHLAKAPVANALVLQLASFSAITKAIKPPLKKTGIEPPPPPPPPFPPTPTPPPRPPPAPPSAHPAALSPP